MATKYELVAAPDSLVEVTLAVLPMQQEDIELLSQYSIQIIVTGFAARENICAFLNDRFKNTSEVKGNVLVVSFGSQPVIPKTHIAAQAVKLVAALPPHLADMAAFTLATGLRQSNVSYLR